MKTIRCAAAAAACLFLFTGCMFHDDTLSPQNARTKTCTAQEAIPSGAVSLNTDISVGDVTVSYGDGQDVSVQASVKANHGKTASGAEELLGLTEVALTQDGKILRVAVRSSKTRTDMWQWIKQNRPDTDYSADRSRHHRAAKHGFVRPIHKGGRHPPERAAWGGDRAGGRGRCGCGKSHVFR